MKLFGRGEVTEQVLKELPYGELCKPCYENGFACVYYPDTYKCPWKEKEREQSCERCGSYLPKMGGRCLAPYCWQEDDNREGMK